MTAVTGCSIREAGDIDLPALNQVIESAVMSWNLPERVKRLSLPSYYYDKADLLHLTLLVAEKAGVGIVAVAGLEAADEADIPLNSMGLLLHGLYVSPTLHNCGLGKQLLRRAEYYAAEAGYDGVLVKAQAEAVGFFRHRGYQVLPIEDDARHYSHRLWKWLSIA
ncbi:MAG: GNAT family N-acetyltransferase [Thiolinea sp.]